MAYRFKGFIFTLMVKYQNEKIVRVSIEHCTITDFIELDETIKINCEVSIFRQGLKKIVFRIINKSYLKTAYYLIERKEG